MIAVEQVTDSQKELSAAVEGSLPPLSETEQAQMNNASTAMQLNSAQVSLRDAQKNLNGAITEYGTNSTQAAAALRDLNAAQANVTTLQAQVGRLLSKMRLRCGPSPLGSQVLLRQALVCMVLMIG